MLLKKLKRQILLNALFYLTGKIKISNGLCFCFEKQKFEDEDEKFRFNFLFRLFLSENYLKKLTSKMLTEVGIFMLKMHSFGVVYINSNMFLSYYSLNTPIPKYTNNNNIILLYL